MITFTNVTKQYGTHIALKDVSFGVTQGEFVCVIGPSGAGKTTIAKLILGAEQPTSGTVKIDGVDVSTLEQTALNHHRQGIGMVFQDFKLLPYKTVFENVAFVLEVCGASDEEIARRVPEVLSVVNMATAKHKVPRELSGGEQQRIAIARAIAHRPRLVIADEPTGNLDRKHAEEVINLLRTIHALHTTVILMTHDHSIVESLPARVIALEHHTVAIANL
jgi:cell division transport system ATP-binding protein